MYNWCLASRHGMGRYLGSLLSTQPSVGVSSPTEDSLSPALDTQAKHQRYTLRITSRL